MNMHSVCVCVCVCVCVIMYSRFVLHGDGELWH